MSSLVYDSTGLDPGGEDRSGEDHLGDSSGTRHPLSLKVAVDESSQFRRTKERGRTREKGQAQAQVQSISVEAAMVAAMEADEQRRAIPESRSAQRILSAVSVTATGDANLLQPSSTCAAARTR